MLTPVLLAQVLLLKDAVPSGSDDAGCCAVGQMAVQEREVPGEACAASRHARHTRAKLLRSWGLPRRWDATRERTPLSRLWGSCKPPASRTPLESAALGFIALKVEPKPTLGSCTPPGSKTAPASTTPSETAALGFIALKLYHSTEA